MSRYLATFAVALGVLLGAPAVVSAQANASAEAVVVEREDDALTFRARLAVPLVSAEIVNNEYGTNVLLGGSLGLDIGEALVLELGGSWLERDTEGFDVFARVGWFFELIETRTSASATGWQHGVVANGGYRFLNDADEAEGLEGSTAIHAATIGAGWRSTKFWDGIGLEFRVLPVVSVGLDETRDGAWGQAAPSMDPTAFFGDTTVGNSEDFAWGVDLELSVGVAF